MNTYISLVSEFHLAFKHPQPTAPRLADSKINALRPALIIEELRELKHALDTNNRVDTLDALCDIQYVLSGAILAWGFRTMWKGSRITIDLRRIRNMSNHIGAMIGLTGQLEVASELGFEMQTLTFLGLLQSRLTQAVHHLGFAHVFDAAFAEVHRSNLSKLWTDSEVHYNDQSGLIFQITGGGYIATNELGKIIKSPSYSPANLEQFVK